MVRVRLIPVYVAELGGQFLYRFLRQSIQVFSVFLTVSNDLVPHSRIPRSFYMIFNAFGCEFLVAFRIEEIANIISHFDQFFELHRSIIR